MDLRKSELLIWKPQSEYHFSNKYNRKYLLFQMSIKTFFQSTPLLHYPP